MFRMSCNPGTVDCDGHQNQNLHDLSKIHKPDVIITGSLTHYLARYFRRAVVPAILTQTSCAQTSRHLVQILRESLASTSSLLTYHEPPSSSNR